MSNLFFEKHENRPMLHTELNWLGHKRLHLWTGFVFQRIYVASDKILR